MRWPFGKKQFEPQGYAAQTLNEFEAQAANAGSRKQITGYIQAAASAWAEVFALAEVQASEAVLRALSPVVLAEFGRDLILHGGSFHRLFVVAGDIRLQRPLSVYRLAQGGGWQLQVGEPSRPSLMSVADEGVLFIPWQTEAANPYLPIAPWRNATGNLIKELESLLFDEISGPMGSVLFLSNPHPFPDQDSRKKSGKAYGKEFEGIRNERGKLMILNNPSQGLNKGFTQDSVGKPFRIGAAPPSSLTEIRTQLGAEILAACSIPPAMLAGGVSGPATITARRNFERTIIPARFKIVSEYLSQSFGEKVAISYPVKYRADISTSARTVAALVKADIDKEEAMKLAGLK